MYSNAQLAELRVKRFVGERLRPALYRESAPLNVTAWEVPDEPVPFAEAMAQPFTPFSVGSAWGKPWGTVWFHVTGTVPADWSLTDGRLELILDLGFTNTQPGFQAEGLVYAPDGRILKGLEPRNNTISLDLEPGDPIDVYVEGAANPDVQESLHDWAPVTAGRKSTAGSEAFYRVRRMDVGVLDVPVWELDRDIWTLIGLADELPEELPRRAEIIRALDHVVDIVDPFDVSATAPAAREVLAPVLAKPAYESAHRLIAVGHAHIDSAWLWPVRETIRKCARTFSNVLALMDEDPDFVFACSSAQQYAWMKEHYPDLFERIKERVAEGRFVPVGGMWVESDTNMPGGEALARQLIEGKQFFIDEFGFEPLDVWLPDSFGYTAALPQIAAAAGSNAFLTQKLSWNEVNVFPHTTFSWEGIDGTRILTHFPPVNTYNSDLSGFELALAQRNYVEKGTANTSLVPFGYGDGGGGPTREMLAAAKRTASLEGSPKVRLDTPAHFFEIARSENVEPGVWTGELYLEFHRGTYTSQARTKRGNRRSERLLHEAELWATTAAVIRGADYPYDLLQKSWHTVLLQQFHDILPGSSIGWVYDVAEVNYEQVRQDLEGLIAASLEALGNAREVAVSYNASPYPVSGVPAYGAAPVATARNTVTLERDGGDLVIANRHLRLLIDSDGLIASLIDAATGREVIPSGTRGNLLQLFRDTPTQWDAWDLDKEYRNVGDDLVDADEIEVIEQNEALVRIRIARSFGSSSLVQTLAVGADSRSVEITTEVDWHERKRLLKLAFPIDVHTSSAVSEIQFGHLERPTHTNTSWDTARFETVAHRWVHVSDASFGVAIANDSTYGHDVTRTALGAAAGSAAGTPSAGTFTTVRQSLLRAPVFPDPEADQGAHLLRSSIIVGDIPSAIEEGYRLNTPLREHAGSILAPLVTSDNPAVVVETVKLALDRSGDVIVRLYEAHGTRASAQLTTSFEHASVVRTDLLERTLGDAGAGRIAPASDAAVTSDAAPASDAGAASDAAPASDAAAASDAGAASDAAAGSDAGAASDAAAASEDGAAASDTAPGSDTGAASDPAAAYAAPTPSRGAAGARIALDLNPFELITLRFAR